MIRTQIYLTKMQRNRLCAFAGDVGQPQSELIRQAIGEYLERNLVLKQDKLSLVRAIKGMWAKSDRLNSAGLCQEWHRQHGNR
jgi:hypothetical protein